MTMKSPRTIALALALGAIGTAGAIGAATPAQASTLLSTSYEHKNFGGSRLTHTNAVDGLVCTTTSSDVDVWDESFSASWDNRISSFQAYNNCAIKAYDYANFGGASLPYFAADLGDLGILDNAASSYQWS
jgi:hypothetical protein